MEKIILEIPKEDIEEVIHLLRYAMYEEPTSNDVWTLLAPFCEEHSSIKFDGREEEFLMNKSKNSGNTTNTMLDILQSKEELLECIQNLMGVFDTPVSRRLIKGDFTDEVRKIGRQILESNGK